jgi:hypothetical protein
MYLYNKYIQDNVTYSLCMKEKKKVSSEPHDIIFFLKIVHEILSYD